MDIDKPKPVADSDSSDQEDEEVDPKIASLSTHELMLKLYVKMSKIEEKRIPRIKKSIKDLEANQVETNEKIETIEEKQKINEDQIEKNREDNEATKESINQIEFNQRNDKNEIKAIADELDNKLDEKSDKIMNFEERIKKLESNKTPTENKEEENKELNEIKNKINEMEKNKNKKLKEMEENFRKTMDTKIKQLQQEIEKKDLEKGTAKPIQSSLMEELRQAEETNKENPSLNFAAAVVAVPEKSSISTNANPNAPIRQPTGNRTRVNKGEKTKYKSIPLETPQAIVKEAATNVGIC